MGKLDQLIAQQVAKQYPAGMPKAPAAVALEKEEKLSASEKYIAEIIRQLKSLGLPEPVREFRFHPERQWRSDLAYPEKKILIEFDGGGFGRPVQCHHCRATVMRKLKDGRWSMVREGGRHSGGLALEKDNEKRNAAIALGFRPLGFAPKHVKDGYAAQLVASIYNSAI